MTGPRPDLPGLPETVPARMVNEFVYCPRLFYLEWVQGRFATSDDVEEGLYVHRVVDEPGGDLPDLDPPDLDAPHTAGRPARSVWLTSASLGVSAKLDLVETDTDGTVTPVDYKKGSPDRHGRPWPADEAQSLLQALLLRDAGYTVDHAEIWYDEPRRRVSIPVTETAIATIRGTLDQLWRAATANTAPPPLIDSPKCPRCSLVGICLPDETNALRTRAATPRRPRSVMAANPDNRPVYVMEQGAVVGVRRGRLEVIKGIENLGSYRLIDVSQVCIYGNVTLSAQVMRELFAREIPVCWFSYGGWFSGMAEGLPGKHVDLRRAQFTTPPEKLLAVAGNIVAGKIRNSRTLLRRNSRIPHEDTIEQLRGLAVSAATPSGYPTLLGLEGTAARLYFARFTSMLRSHRRPRHHRVRHQRPRPPPTSGPGELAALVRLRAPGEGPDRDPACRRIRPLHRRVSPPPLRTSRPRPRPRRRVPAADRRQHRHPSDQQR